MATNFWKKNRQKLQFFLKKHGKEGSHTVIKAWIMTTMPKNMTVMPSSWQDHGKIIAWQPYVSNPGCTLFQFSVQLMSVTGKVGQNTPFLAKWTHHKSTTSYLKVVWYMMQTLVCNKIFSGARQILLDVEQNFLKKSRFKGNCIWFPSCKQSS